MREESRGYWLRMIQAWCESRGYKGPREAAAVYIEDTRERFEVWCVESLHCALTDRDHGVRLRALFQVAEYRGRLSGEWPRGAYAWIGDAFSAAKEETVDAVRRDASRVAAAPLAKASTDATVDGEGKAVAS